MKTVYFPCIYGCNAINSNNFVSVYSSGTKNTVISSKTKHKYFNSNIFFVRGFVYLFFGLYYFLTGLAQAEKSTQPSLITSATKSLNLSKRQVLIFCYTLFAFIVALLLLGFLPMKLSFYLTPLTFNMVLKKLIVAVSKVIIIYLFIMFTKLIPEFREFYRFNGAINQIKAGQKYYPLNFLNFLIFGFLTSNFVVSFLGLTYYCWYAIFVNLGICVAVFCLCYEVLNLLCKCKLKWVKNLCTVTHWLVVNKFGDVEQKCVSLAETELMLMNNKKREITKEMENQNSISFADAYTEAKEILTKANKFEKSDLDFIFCEVLNKSRAQIKLLNHISKVDYKKVLVFVNRRAKGEPISSIFKKVNFYGQDFTVNNNVLSPRLDTEFLVETAIKSITKKSTVLDLCCGSGCIAITIAKQTGAKVVATDISEKALEVAKQNNQNVGTNVKFIKSDLFKNLKFKKFDVIVSNPPYIKSADINKLEDEVKNYDPLLALDGGESGLEFYKKIIQESPKHLNKKGKLYFEIGHDQAKDVKNMLQNQFEDIILLKDYCGKQRVVVATLK